jgi:hypothetical protein
MKKKYIIIAVFGAVILIFMAYGFMTFDIKPVPKQNQPAENGFAVIELFTSEGCSSCPPADKAIADLLARHIKNVYVLVYHVDYWNRLGWKDRFSKAEYSERQNQYASVLRLNSVYTPQVIVNGFSEFVGSDQDKLNSTVEDELQKESKQNVSIVVAMVNNTVNINYNTGGNDEVLLNLALVQPGATTDVKSGENEGMLLHHVNIVRLLKTINANGKGMITIQIPEGLTNEPLQLIAYTQNKENFKILGADQITLNPLKTPTLL